jgi:hypothetical protein
MICTCEITALGKVANPNCPECGQKPVGIILPVGVEPTYAKVAKWHFEDYTLNGFWVLVQEPNGSTGPFYGKSRGGLRQVPLLGELESDIVQEIRGYPERFKTSRYFLCLNDKIIRELSDGAENTISNPE